MGADFNSSIPIGSGNNAAPLAALKNQSATTTASTPAAPPQTQPEAHQPEGYWARTKDYLADNALTRLVSGVIAGTSNLYSNRPGHPVIGKKPTTKLAGYCAHNVVAALNAAGVHVTSANAKDLPAPLKAAGFNSFVPRDCDKPLAGDVMVIAGIGQVPPKGQKPKPGEHPYGHVAVYTGDPPKGCGWVSDGIQYDDKFCLRGVSKAEQAAKTTYFRNPTLAAQAVKAGFALTIPNATTDTPPTAPPTGLQPSSTRLLLPTPAA